MDAIDLAALIHPTLAVACVFPVIGIVANLSWQTRQRRLQTVNKEKSKIPPVVGAEHVKYGRWLAAAVVMLAWLGLVYSIAAKVMSGNLWQTELPRVIFLSLMSVLTVVSLVLLYRAKPKLWRGVFATLTGMGLVVLGAQPEIYRQGHEWFISHYYYGIIAAFLMIFSQAIVPEIYTDRKNAWRRAHVFLNCIALLLFIGEGFTGTKALLEIPLTWQTPYVQQLYEKGCQSAAPDNPCSVQPPAEAPVPVE